MPRSDEKFLARLAESRAETDALFKIPQTGALYDRPIPERHRIIFYLGHLEAFDWNLLGRRAWEMESFHPQFDQLFAFGIDPVGGGLPTDKPSDWPALDEVNRYNSAIRGKLDGRLRETSLSASDGSLTDEGIHLNVAIEHRLMHAETLAYMLHQLPLDRKCLERLPEDSAAAGPQNRMIQIPEGEATMGIDRRPYVFGWDNEFEANTEHVPAFEIDQHKVTNAEFLKFMREGGYQNHSFWSDGDWAWIQMEGITHPKFWIRRGEQWFYRTMFAEIPLPLAWPVHVSHAEAAAYTRWAGKSLPTEAQFHRAAYGTPEGNERAYPWGDAPPRSELGDFDFASWDSEPVNAHPAGRSAFGVADLVGNGWEWTSTPFQPFPGFEPFPFYQGYSANFFDGKHYVMKGGSSRTAACMLRRSFRNWFQPHYQYIYSGFRCVSN